MIEVKNLTKKYGNKIVLDRVSFTVNEGEILGLLGPNGAGKSTTMNILTGNLAATEGAVSIAGFDIAEDPLAAKAKLGYLPEIPPLYADMTVDAYLKFVYRLKKCRLPFAEHLTEVCRAAHIEEVRKRVIKNLSKGYRQRIGIAQALIGKPEVVILDEPTVGLDPKQMTEIRSLISGLGKKHTVILSSHILPEVQAVCDRIVVINQGRVIADDTPENLSKSLAGNRLQLVAEAPEKELREGLMTIPGVLAVRALPCSSSGCVKFEISAAGSLDLRRPIAAWMKQSPYLLLEMTASELSLENIFLKLTGAAQTERKGGKNR